MDNHEYWVGLHRRPLVEKLDTMSEAWFDRACWALFECDDVQLYDWRPKGQTRVITIHGYELDPKRAVARQLRARLKAEGVSPTRVRRGALEWR